MRLLVFATIFTFVTWPALAQYPETGGDPDDGTGSVKARPLGDPGASQDAEAAREKLLKASDQIDQVAANSEATKAALDGLKAQLAQIQTENTALKAQVSTLQDTVVRQQDALDEVKAARIKDRQAIIDEVASLVAGKSAPHHPRTDDTATDDPPPRRKSTCPTPPRSPPPTPPTPRAAAKLDSELSAAAGSAGPRPGKISRRHEQNRRGRLSLPPAHRPLPPRRLSITRVITMWSPRTRHFP